MKNIKHLIFIVVALGAASCKGYLDVKPQGKVIIETDEEYQAVLMSRINRIEDGSYDDVVGNTSSVMMYESFTDNLNASISAGRIYIYAGSQINSLSGNYSDWYAVIKDCNIIISGVSSRTGELPRKLMGASYGLKAICYYNLIRNYCDPYDPKTAGLQMGMPIVDQFNIEAKPLRSDLKATVDYTITLFKQALTYQMNDPVFFFTEDIVKAYLAKMYFWAQYWPEALALCEELLAKPEYALVERANYAEMIQARYDKKPGVVVRSYINNTNSNFDSDFNIYLSDSKTRPVNKTLIDLFEADGNRDVRKALSFDNRRQNLKHLIARIREAELCLMAAECYYHENNPNEALRLLNLLRSKRITDNVDYTMSTLPPVKAGALITVNAKGEVLDDLLSAIFDERRKELYMEGDRWFEMKRNGRPEWWVVVNALKYTTSVYMYTFPLPKSDIDMGYGLVQNDGYTS